MFLNVKNYPQAISVRINEGVWQGYYSWLANTLDGSGRML